MAAVVVTTVATAAVAVATPVATVDAAAATAPPARLSMSRRPHRKKVLRLPM
jgi:hypothetical protein